MQEWTLETFNHVLKNEDVFCLYLYTPMCGTCQVASKMLTISLEILPLLKCGKINLNYASELAEAYQIESVPCLLIFKDGEVQNKLYAFHSVPYLHGLLKQL